MHHMATQPTLPPVLMVARMQKCSERFLLIEDIGGRHFVVDKADAGPIRAVVYVPYYPTDRRH